MGSFENFQEESDILIHRDATSSSLFTTFLWMVLRGQGNSLSRFKTTLFNSTTLATSRTVPTFTTLHMPTLGPAVIAAATKHSSCANQCTTTTSIQPTGCTCDCLLDNPDRARNGELARLLSRLCGCLESEHE